MVQVFWHFSLNFIKSYQMFPIYLLIPLLEGWDSGRDMEKNGCSQAFSHIVCHLPSVGCHNDQFKEGCHFWLFWSQNYGKSVISAYSSCPLFFPYLNILRAVSRLDLIKVNGEKNWNLFKKTFDLAMLF